MIPTPCLGLEINKEKSKFQKPLEIFRRGNNNVSPSAKNVLTLNKYIGSSRSTLDLC